MPRKNATPPRVLSPGGVLPTAPVDPKPVPSLSEQVDNKNKRAVVLHDPRIYVFDQNGQLHCTESKHTPLKGSLPWCNDIEFAIRNGVDANWCFDPGQIVVPMFPTHGMYAEVRVDDAILAGSRQIFVPIRKGGNFTDGLDFVGFISPGEGRMILRSMLLEWMGNKRALLECESRLHGNKQEKLIRSFKDNPGLAAANAWSTIIDGLCIPCSKWADPDTDDLGLGDL